MGITLRFLKVKKFRLKISQKAKFQNKISLNIFCYIYFVKKYFLDTILIPADNIPVN